MKNQLSKMSLKKTHAKNMSVEKQEQQNQQVKQMCISFKICKQPQTGPTDALSH